MRHPAVRIGALAGFGGTTRLPRLVGKGRAAELLLTGRLVSAEEALQIVLINRLVEPENLLAEAEGLVLEILSHAPVAVRMTWEAMHRGMNMTLEESTLLGADYFGLVVRLRKISGREPGPFLEKTSPSFREEDNREQLEGGSRYAQEMNCNSRAVHMKVFLSALLIALAMIGFDVLAEESPPLRMLQTIPLPNVEGRIDHIAVDVKGQRLFIAALGNNSVEVLDLRAGKHLQSIAELHEPQGVAFIREFNKIFIANGKNGACDILDGSSLKPIQSVKFSDDADNIRYGAVARRIYVGYESGGLGIIDPANGKQIGDIKLDAHPESFQLEKSGPRIFVNLPASRKIAVVNWETRKTVATWPAAGAAANFPMAFDETHHRLLVGFRKPAKLVVFDTETGKIVANLDSPGDADDIFFDEARAQIYVSGGEGLIAVVQQQDADHYKTVAKIPTAPGARTSLWVPEMNRLYLAVPHRGSQRAEVRVYEAQP